MRSDAERINGILARNTPIGDGDMCWLWLGTAGNDGYGRIWVNFSRLAHRMQWQRFNGPIPNGLFVCHHCDMPLCVNPRHLFLGTQKDNMQDAARKGRMGQGETHHNAKLTEAQVLAIRKDPRIQTEIAKEYGVANTAISKIKSRKRWGHL